MKKLLVSIKKEKLLIIRDIEGILLIFLMPLILVFVITLLQHRTFQTVLESKIPIVIVDCDNDSLGISFRKGIEKTNMFEISVINSENQNSLKQAREDVANGTYQLGIYIPAKSTEKIKNKTISLIQNQLQSSIITSNDLNTKAEIQLFFDPVAKPSFRSLIKSQLTEFAARTEAKLIYESYSKVIDALTNQTTELDFPSESTISFEEDLVSEYTSGILPNAVQHNVPAWTLFGMFLICIPIAGNIIKERNEGCLARLKTLPVTYFNLICAKSVVYVIILLIQAMLIILVGMYLMPLLGLPKLQVSNNWAALIVISIASALAATGYGIAIGSLALTQVQASTFGSISTVILAAIGGVWIPVIVMPKTMRMISEFSPMNWGINGYYDVFLRSSNTIEILPWIIRLIIFYLICMLLSISFRRYHIKS